MNMAIEELAKLIKSAKSVTVFTHMRPDGDAVGSSLALSRALEILGIPHEVCDETDIPSNLTFVGGVEKFKKQPELASELFVAVDCADVARLGALAETFRLANKKKTTVNIDHHVSNTRYATYNFVRDCSSNTMNICLLIEAMGVPFDQKIADYLMMGLLTDSGSFSHDDVTEETFLIAAKLVKAGADVGKLNSDLFKRQKKARAALYAHTMNRIRYVLDDRLAIITLPLETLERFGADVGMTEGFVDFPLTVETVEVSASIMEIKKGQYKISLRSKTYADVNGVAGTFGGGGHVRAAGCMLFGELEEVIDRLTYAVYQYL
ncbi:MAG: bifunctional oligoribonuclease/PAP phosphatase NrnA [Clostridia bacterium]|nr:bifunctional oligoribonuclease/PAP phosphatase NrnA [Clostridia bacterium]